MRKSVVVLGSNLTDLGTSTTKTCLTELLIIKCDKSRIELLPFLSLNILRNTHLVQTISTDRFVNSKTIQFEENFGISNYRISSRMLTLCSLLPGMYGKS